jgi:hypothetical protein
MEAIGSDVRYQLSQGAREGKRDRSLLYIM